MPDSLIRGNLTLILCLFSLSISFSGVVPSLNMNFISLYEIQTMKDQNRIVFLQNHTITIRKLEMIALCIFMNILNQFVK